MLAVVFGVVVFVVYMSLYTVADRDDETIYVLKPSTFVFKL